MLLLHIFIYIRYLVLDINIDKYKNTSDRGSKSF